MPVMRDEETGKFISSNPDAMSKAIIERRANTRGMKVLRKLIAIHEKAREEQQ